VYFLWLIQIAPFEAFERMRFSFTAKAGLPARLNKAIEEMFKKRKGKKWYFN